jgi:hypothetical protein
MRSTFPEIPYAAALIGPGSDVLGYDTARSMDHDWGPRLNLVLTEQDFLTYRDEILFSVESVLPESLRGVPVDHRGSAQRPGGALAFNNSMGLTRPHGVMIDTAPQLLNRVIGISDLSHLDTASWLATPQQSLLEFTAGPVFRDAIGELTAMRTALAWYPADIWYALMAAQWQRIAQLESLVGRTGEVDDDLGSQVIAVTIVRDAMRLALLQQRQYAPYPKWLGSAFARLTVAPRLTSALDRARYATDWQTREDAVVTVLATLGGEHDALGITVPVNARVQAFFDRPYRVLYVEQYSDALHEAISDPAIRTLPYDIGNIDTITDSTLALANPGFRSVLAMWFRTPRRSTF